MSDFLDSSRAGEIDRVSARLAFLAPGGRSQVFFGAPRDFSGLEAFAIVSNASPDAQDGFELVLTKTYRKYKRLGSVIEGMWRQLPVPAAIHDLGMKFCKMTGMSAVVGSRICGTTVPGMREYYYLKQGLVSGSHDWHGRLMNLLWETMMSFGGTGALPVIGATAASAWVCIFAWALQGLVDIRPWYFGMAALCILSTIVCCFLEEWAKRHYFAEDPREVVLDEVAGMSLAVLIVGPSVGAIIAAFFAFRFSDIFKFGIHWIEKQRVLGTIVWDDLLAGIYAGLLVKSALFLSAAIFYE